jgi:MoxR-like ATPase
MRYALRLVRSTRVGEASETARPRMVQDYLSWGAGPRASEYLVLGAKARAILTGHDHASIEHVREVALPVLRHRILLNFNAEADQVKPDDVIRAMLEEIPVEIETASERRQMDKVLR